MARRLFVLLALAGSLASIAWPARASNDPRLLWETIQTPHFRITFYSTEEEVAKRVATLSEGIYERLIPLVTTQPCSPTSRSWPACGSPSSLTDILLTDQTDSANGSATALPYNAIRLNVTAPDDMSPLGDMDDWYLELVTHEYTHIVHTDHIRGLAALANAIFGKIFAPNQVQPRWLLEGLAIFEESERTTGGRLRSSMWNMFMRADVLENNLAPLDVFSNPIRRWPQGNIWYVYGSFFMKWLAETYGEQAIRAIIDDYAWQAIPFAINRSVRRATGRTYEQLYVDWVESMKQGFGAHAAAVRARGLREGIRLTHGGNTAEHPRWVPANTWPEYAGNLVYIRDDGHSTPGWWALPLARDAENRIVGAREGDRELLIRTNGVGGLSFMPTGAVAFSSEDFHNNLFVFHDLFELLPHEKSKVGWEPSRVRLSDGWRALDPSVSPDGRRMVFTTNHRGTTYLMQADVVASDDQPETEHALANVRPLVPSGRFDQAFTPRWAPDGRHVAYSSWQRGGYRDVRIVDTRDGSFVEVTHDRAIDGDPVFSPDGRWLFFHSDRTGIMNIYAYELSSGRLKQVTNVITGAYEPEPSPDGRWLAYVGYTHDGFDIFVMPLDESQWLEAESYVDTRGTPPAEPPPPWLTVRSYNPWPTLHPRHYSVQITPGNFGQAAIIGLSEADIAGIHAFDASWVTEWERPEPQGSLAYAYGRLPFDIGANVFRQITPQSNYHLGPNIVPWVQEAVGGSTGVTYALQRAFDVQTFALSYGFARIAGQLPLPKGNLNPYDTPNIVQIQRGLLGSLHLGWGYSNSQGYLWSVGAEKGIDIGASFDLSDPALASDFSGYAAVIAFTSHFSMPWLRHHALSLHAEGGTSGGNAAGHGPFYVGGFIDLPLVKVVQNTLIQGGVHLRGYPVTIEVGHNYGLFTGEYRFPIVNVDHGPSTLPVFLNRVSGVAFVDYGSAFDQPETAEFKTGVGGELWFDFTLGYTLGFTFRAGFAKGLASGGIDKTYFVAAVPF